MPPTLTKVPETAAKLAAVPEKSIVKLKGDDLQVKSKSALEIHERSESLEQHTQYSKNGVQMMDAIFKGSVQLERSTFDEKTPRVAQVQDQESDGNKTPAMPGRAASRPKKNASSPNSKILVPISQYNLQLGGKPAPRTTKATAARPLRSRLQKSHDLLRGLRKKEFGAILPLNLQQPKVLGRSICRDGEDGQHESLKRTEEGTGTQRNLEEEEEMCNLIVGQPQNSRQRKKATDRWDKPENLAQVLVVKHSQ